MFQAVRRLAMDIDERFLIFEKEHKLFSREYSYV
jgi:hypothetical protein